jgi:uncharacterized protein (TIGR02284 family)
MEIKYPMATQSEEVVSVLNELIATCEDGASGYRKAATDSQDAHLKTLYRGYETQRTKFAEELSAAVEAEGGRPVESAHAGSVLHRGWMTVKEALGNTDTAILEECEAGEVHAMKAYRDAFDKNLPGVAGDLVSRQFAAVHEAHTKLRALRHKRN